MATSGEVQDVGSAVYAVIATAVKWASLPSTIWLPRLFQARRISSTFKLVVVRGRYSLSAPSGGRILAWAAVVFLFTALVIGALLFWLGVPTLLLWVLSRLTDSSTKHFVLGMISVPSGMAVFGIFLIWLNSLYLRAADALQGKSPAGLRSRSEGPLVPLLAAAALLSIAAFCVWFFLLNHSAFPAAPGSL